MAQMPFSPCDDPSACTDTSVAMLSRIFGPVIDALVTGADINSVAASANILATMFGFFNSGILIIGSLIVSYVAIMGVTNTANDGEAMGKSWSSLWTPVRIVSGGAVLLPTTSGFSFIQLIVLMFALWGVGFANGTYKIGMAMGILSPNGVVQGVNAPGNFYGLRDFARQYLGASYCARAANAIYADNTATGATPEVMAGGTADKTTVVDGRTENTFYIKDRNALTNLAGGAPFCGTIKVASYVPQKQDDVTANSIEQLRANVQTKKVNAAVQMMAEIDSWVNQWPKSINDEGWDKVNSDRFNTIVNKWEEKIATDLVAQVSSDQGVDNGLRDYVKALVANGWADAGGWFQRVGMIRGQISGVLSESVGSVGAPSLSALPADARASLLVSSVTTITEAINKKSEEKASYKTSTTSKPEDLASLIPKNPKSDINPGSIRADMDAKMSSFVNKIMLDVVEIATGAGSNGQTPLCGTAGQMGGSLNRMKCIGDYLTVARAGIGMADVAIKTAATGLRVIAGTLSSVKGVGTGLDLDKIVTPVWDWVIEVPIKQLALMASYIEPLAFYFGVFLPSLPYTIFMIVFAGWVLAVLQSTIAVSLWAVMHMTPDRTFVGSQSQGYLLLLSLFARPALAIVGLFAAVLVSDPMIDYIAKGFFSMRGAVVSSTGTVGAIAEFLTFAWWFMVFGLTLLPVLYMTFGLPQVLPDHVLRWIGAGIGDLGETSAMNQMRGGIAAVGSGISGGKGNPTLRFRGNNGLLPSAGDGGPPGGPRGGGGGRLTLWWRRSKEPDSQLKPSGVTPSTPEPAPSPLSDSRSTGARFNDASGGGAEGAITDSAAASAGRAGRNAGGAVLSSGTAGAGASKGAESGSLAARGSDPAVTGVITGGAGLGSAASAGVNAPAGDRGAQDTSMAGGAAPSGGQGSDQSVNAPAGDRGAQDTSMAGGAAPSGGQGSDQSVNAPAADRGAQDTSMAGGAAPSGGQGSDQSVNAPAADRGAQDTSMAGGAAPSGGQGSDQSVNAPAADRGAQDTSMAGGAAPSGGQGSDQTVNAPAADRGAQDSSMAGRAAPSGGQGSDQTVNAPAADRGAQDTSMAGGAAPSGGQGSDQSVNAPAADRGAQDTSMAGGAAPSGGQGSDQSVNAPAADRGAQDTSMAGGAAPIEEFDYARRDEDPPKASG